MAHQRCSLPAWLRPWGLHLALIAGTLSPLAAPAQDGGVVPVVVSTPGGRGAQIYCYMRGSGNSHQVSWDAAYEVIKRQGGGLFRTSPQHAAVMITEAVVQSPETFPNCGMHLGDLFRREEAETAAKTAGTPMSRGERYGS